MVRVVGCLHLVGRVMRDAPFLALGSNIKTRPLSDGSDHQHHFLIRHGSLLALYTTAWANLSSTTEYERYVCPRRRDVEEWHSGRCQKPSKEVIPRMGLALMHKHEELHTSFLFPWQYWSLLVLLVSFVVTKIPPVVFTLSPSYLS